MSYLAFLEWKIGKIRSSRNKWKKAPKNPSTSSSSRHRDPKDVQEPPREERIEDEAEVLPENHGEDEIPPEMLEEEAEDDLPVFEDYDLNALIEEKLKELQKENGSEENPLDGIEKRKVKVSYKKQLIFEIPLPVKDEKTVEEVVKVLISHVEDQN